MEKAKCRAAIEAAQASQRLAEIEAQKRHNAELTARREIAEKKKALKALAHNDIRYRKYSIEEIEVATNHFAESLKIGEGGYGPVYKASLDHTPVAIKVLRPDAAQGRRQFQQEVCSLLVEILLYKSKQYFNQLHICVFLPPYVSNFFPSLSLSHFPFAAHSSVLRFISPFSLHCLPSISVQLFIPFIFSLSSVYLSIYLLMYLYLYIACTLLFPSFYVSLFSKF